METKNYQFYKTNYKISQFYSMSVVSYASILHVNSIHVYSSLNLRTIHYVLYYWLTPFVLKKLPKHLHMYKMYITKLTNCFICLLAMNDKHISKYKLSDNSETKLMSEHFSNSFFKVIITH